MDKDKPIIIIGSDHAAFELKEKIKAYLLGKGYSVEDAGTHSTASVSYVDYGRKVAGAVSRGKFSRGILLCGTGLGMSMVANRFCNVRAALCSDIFSVKMSRVHNDSNILVLGGRILGGRQGQGRQRRRGKGGRHEGELGGADHALRVS